MSPPVITIDGPAASGKGTVAERVAQALGFHYLDSGALYRLTAWQARRHGVGTDQPQALADLAAQLSPRIESGEIWLEGCEVSTELRSETCAAAASELALWPEVRSALLQCQRGFRRSPGLVADGRDMGSVVFVDATLKVYLTATPLARAQRRHKQLSEKGLNAKIEHLVDDMERRDQRDASRAAAPLRQGDARYLDSSHCTIEQVVLQILEWYATV